MYVSWWDGAVSISTVYDATADAWCGLPAMSKVRNPHGMMSVDDCRLYVFSGDEL